MNSIYAGNASGYAGVQGWFSEIIKFRDLEQTLCMADDILPLLINPSYISDEDAMCHREINLRYDIGGLEWSNYERNGEIRWSQPGTPPTKSFKICNYLEVHYKRDQFDEKCSDEEQAQYDRQMIQNTVKRLHALHVNYVLHMIQAQAGNRFGSEAAGIVVTPDDINIFMESIVQRIRDQQAYCNDSDYTVFVPYQFRVLLMQSKWAECDKSCSDLRVFETGNVFKTVNGLRIATTQWLRPVKQEGDSITIPMMVVNRKYVAFYGKIFDRKDIGPGADHNNPTAKSMHMYALHGGFIVRPETQAMAYITFEFKSFTA